MCYASQQAATVAAEEVKTDKKKNMNGISDEINSISTNGGPEDLETVVLDKSTAALSQHKKGSANGNKKMSAKVADRASLLLAKKQETVKNIGEEAISEMTASQLKSYSGVNRIQKRNDAEKELEAVVSEGMKTDSKSPETELYFKDGKRRVDFVLAFDDNGDVGQASERRMFEEQLEEEGLELEHDFSSEQDTDKVGFLKLHAPWDVLCSVGAQLKMRVPVCLNEDDDEEEDSLSKKENWLETYFRLSESDAALLPKIQPYYTAPFDDSRADHYLIADRDAFFSSIQRIQIVWDILQHIPISTPNNPAAASQKLFSVAFKVKNFLNNVQKASTPERPMSAAETDTTTDSVHNTPQYRRMEDLKSAHSEGLTKRGIEWLLEEKVYIAAFPIHDGPDEAPKDYRGGWSHRQILRHTWASFKRIFTVQPLDHIRCYFGEQNAFYFAWLGFYTQMLAFPSLFGLGCFVYSLAVMDADLTIRDTCHEEYPGNLTLCPTCVPPNCEFEELDATCTETRWGVIFDNSSTIFMAAFTVIWISVFQKLWNRKEAAYASRWDALGEERIDHDVRPQYEARAPTVRINPVTKRKEPFIPMAQKARWLSCSVAVLLCLIALVVIALVALIPVKILICGMFMNWGGGFAKKKLELSKLTTDFLTFLVVMALTAVYEKGAHRLTEHECPRTHSDYLTSFIWKLYIFEMLNNFIPVFYVAFIKGRILNLPSELTYFREMCDPGGCVNEVVSTVAVLLLFRLVVSNAAELGIPLLKTVLKKRSNQNSAKSSSRWQEDFQLNELELDGVYSEYMEMLVQYGYIALFASVFPLLPLMCFLNNLVEIRLDAINRVVSHRRPLPIRVSGIGIWKQCLDILNKTAVLCNAAILAFTTDFIPTILYQMWYSPDGTQNGYMVFKMSQFNLDDWPSHSEELRHHKNVSICWYQGYQAPPPSYETTEVWWQIITCRLILFIFFVVISFFCQWLCDFLISDIPKDVQLREERARYLAKKALYPENRRKSRQVSQFNKEEKREESELLRRRGQTSAAKKSASAAGDKLFVRRH